MFYLEVVLRKRVPSRSARKDKLPRSRLPSLNTRECETRKGNKFQRAETCRYLNVNFVHTREKIRNMYAFIRKTIKTYINRRGCAYLRLYRFALTSGEVSRPRLPCNDINIYRENSRFRARNIHRPLLGGDKTRGAHDAMCHMRIIYCIYRNTRRYYIAALANNFSTCEAVRAAT